MHFKVISADVNSKAIWFANATKQNAAKKGHTKAAQNFESDIGALSAAHKLNCLWHSW